MVQCILPTFSFPNGASRCRSTIEEVFRKGGPVDKDITNKVREVCQIDSLKFVIFIDDCKKNIIRGVQYLCDNKQNCLAKRIAEDCSVRDDIADKIVVITIIALPLLFAGFAAIAALACAKKGRAAVPPENTALLPVI